MNNKFKELIQLKMNQIEQNDFTKFYKFAGKFCKDNYLELGVLTDLFHKADIHPENYLQEIPDYFMSYAHSYCELFAGSSPKHHFTIPNGITTIGKEAFQACDLLTSIDIPSSVTTIKSFAFHSCGFKHFDFPASVDTIPGCCFWYCENLESINIPKTVTTISSEAFNGCKKLVDVYYEGTIEEWRNITTAVHTFKNMPATVVHCSDGDTALRKKRERKKVEDDFDW